MFGIDVVKEVVSKQSNQISLGNMILKAIAEGQCNDLYAKFKYAATREELNTAFDFMIANLKSLLLQINIGSSETNNIKRYCWMLGFLYKAKSDLFNDNEDERRSKVYKKLCVKMLSCSNVTLEDLILRCQTIA